MENLFQDCPSKKNEGNSCLFGCLKQTTTCLDFFKKKKKKKKNIQEEVDGWMGGSAECVILNKKLILTESKIFFP